MGWKTDQAYENTQRKAFKAWKSSLSWRAYFQWQWGRLWPFLAGALSTVAIALLFRFL
jgi:hypothetical protein